MISNSEAKLIDAIAQQMLDGKVSVEEASKLLNTVARFEERVTTLHSNDQQPSPNNRL